MINRRIKKSEIKALQALLHEAYQADTQLGIHFQAANATLPQIDEHIDTTPTFVTEVDHHIVATASVRLPWSADPGPYNLSHLGWIATERRFAKQGYASRLIDWVEQNYLKKELDAPLVSLGTAVEHPWLQKFYTALGYHPVEVVQKHSDHLTIYMVKSLKPGFERLESAQIKEYLQRYRLQGK
ncbi:GNAT family N-acetyltransferase [Lactobacillaceae bacterium L1_55_11]|nr:GNAT family N-acetyltransferase [Lactobacillaceae bacterium L1_55_11]